MRKVVVSEFVSLDGVMEDPMWTFEFGTQEQEDFKHDELAAADALLLGRVTYEGFAAAWPSAPEEEEPEQMNGIGKHVASATLEEPLEWEKALRGQRREQAAEAGGHADLPDRRRRPDLRAPARRGSIAR